MSGSVSTEAIMLDIDHEDALREISKLPLDQRSEALRMWKKGNSFRAFYAGHRDICKADKQPRKKKGGTK